MFTRVLCYVIFVIQLEIVYTIVNNEEHEIITNSKIELESLEISARLNDIIIISAPVINSRTIYYLSKPNGDSSKLNLNTSEIDIGRSYNNTLDKYIEGKLKEIVTSVNKYNTFKQNLEWCPNSSIFGRNKSLKPNDFTIGPLVNEDHGNWVISGYYNNFGEWIEVFQVISIQITELIPTDPMKPNLSLGETFNLRFAYPIEHLETCEVVAPRSTYDRYFDRNRDFEEFCSFRIPNVTRNDEGVWKIIAVGKIVYEANVFLTINSVSSNDYIIFLLSYILFKSKK